MARKTHVHFEAHKPVKEVVVVDFKTKGGKEVIFPAHKMVKEPVVVDFFAKKHK